MLQQVADTTFWEAWNEYRSDNMQTWYDILSIVFWLDGTLIHTFIVWGKSWRPSPVYIDVSIREVRDYTCNVIKNVFSFFLLIENIRLIPCRYLLNLKKMLKTRRMLRLRYMRLILLKRSQYLSHTISSLNWE